MVEQQDKYEMLDTSSQSWLLSKLLIYLFIILSIGSAISYALFQNRLNHTPAEVTSVTTPTPPSSMVSSQAVADKPTADDQNPSPTMPSKPQNVAPAVATTIKTIYFSFDSSQISSSEMAKIRTFSMEIPDRGGELVIEGHSDDIGSLNYNQQLSTRRAEAVVRALQNLGITNKARRITAKGSGESQSIQKSADERALNRKAVLTFRSVN